MTPRENLLRTLSREEHEWVPVCVHIANANNLPGFLPRELLAEPLDRLAISEFVGGDILYEISAVHQSLDDSVKVEEESSSPGSTIRTKRSSITTPHGVLTQAQQASMNPTPAYDNLPDRYALPGPTIVDVHTEHLVKGPRDYAILRDYLGAQSFKVDYEKVAHSTRDRENTEQILQIVVRKICDVSMTKARLQR